MAGNYSSKTLSSYLHGIGLHCLTTTFYSAARLGEFTIPTLLSFNPDTHVAQKHVCQVHDRNGLEQTAFFLPRTKAAPMGEDIYWSSQSGASDPLTLLTNHFSDANVEPLQGHGVPSDVVKTIRHWASDAFTLYLRKHAQILVPYMQAIPKIHELFICYTMPPVH
ncbi:hypothetical protein EV421DRAFT_1887059 [Armillaria borealis]|uniref:Uncharacterized protein n=1 Tax=Armillaria borealis TaxID=47425 RepID=A0AA39K9Y7_9AGAR|nr:hypothetical protein EV421DRAFT_1887059 [Armillaria borealis]